MRFSLTITMEDLSQLPDIHQEATKQKTWLRLIPEEKYTNSKPKICISNECLKTATNLKFSLDPTVDPCDNFYEYTCGKWSEEHPNHGWFSSFSSFTTISERIAISSLEALTTENSGPDDPEALQKSRNFYKSCMDVGSLDELGLTSMYQYLQRANLPIVPNYLTKTDEDKATFTFDWMKSETRIKQIFMMDVLFGAIVDANIYNGSENVIYAGQIYQKCPLPSPLRRRKKSAYTNVFNIVKRDNDDDETETFKQLTRSINSNIIKFILKEIVTNNSIEMPSDDLLNGAADIIMDISDDIEELVANHTDPDAKEDDTFAITFADLQTQTDQLLQNPEPDVWLKYFNYLFKGTAVTINPKKDMLYVTAMDLQFLKRMLQYVQGTDDINLELYMWWATVYAMIINTSSDVVDYISTQLNYFSSGSSSNVARSRSLECALLTDNYLGYAVSYALADRSFLNTTKPKVERMVNELKNAFVEHVNGINWMDRATKQVTLEKSKEMLTFIGYPEWLFENGQLDKYYADVVIKEDTFMDNMINTIISHNLKKMNSLRETHKRDWYSEPIEVNAFNSFSDNAINVPMAILTFPMYNLGLEVLNYGSIGAILGHELTHGFDNIGRKHDKYGNYVQWWSNQTIETFENLTECFIKQYDNFTIDGVEGHVKGKNTLGENLADNGGLNQAFSAYKSYVEKYGEEPQLPGFENFSSYQLFFIAYGSIWCETSTIEDLKDQIEYDEHCPNSIRVLGTLQNSEEFSKTFHCPEGSFMNPKKKCKIW
ncbi:endothelin-converting enzyme homolog isoform X2 [Leptinotarsa decemlineata]|uniref:endothelin-converting enzyme homolog isoform X2 n=1 Tax=Leptinotarsa decemlineata TaxID=7539 RepID=UPI003D309748